MLSGCATKLSLCATFVFYRILKTLRIAPNFSSCECHKCSFVDCDNIGKVDMARGIELACRHVKCGGQQLIVRGFHTLLTVGVLVSLLYKDTVLHRSVIEAENLLYGLAFLLLVIGGLVLYYIACFVDPGYVPLKPLVLKQQIQPTKHDSDSDCEEEACEVDMMLPAADGSAANESEQPLHVKLRRCGFCGIEQPLRARHCEDCGRCVRKYDHHCPWLETCVGERNHRWFLAFLVTESAIIVWAFFIVWESYSHHISWSDWIFSNIIYLIDSGILLIGGFVVIALSCMHTYTMVLNITTWEIVSKERITYLRDLEIEMNPFHEGYIRNTYNFLCTCGLRNWERLYSRNVTLQGGISTV